MTNSQRLLDFHSEILYKGKNFNSVIVMLVPVSSGELTLEEFISGAREHPDIMDMLTKMMDLTHVLEIIIKGQLKNAVN